MLWVPTLWEPIMRRKRRHRPSAGAPPTSRNFTVMGNALQGRHAHVRPLRAPDSVLQAAESRERGFKGSTPPEGPRASCVYRRRAVGLCSKGAEVPSGGFRGVLPSSPGSGGGNSGSGTLLPSDS